jgi:GNAT superfamily N-acetyltransferase
MTTTHAETRMNAPTSTHANAAAPDATLEQRRDGTVQARCSLWWRGTPLHRGRHTGFIGAVESSDNDALVALLARAAKPLRDAGCALAAGPIDGDTWHRYRLVTASDGTPPFALEPYSPPSAVAPWKRAGFAPLETYASFRDDALAQRDPRVPALTARLREAGVTLRALDLGRFDDELAQVHALALRGFAHAPLFAPIGLGAFTALYRPLAPLFDPRLCPVAECDGRIAGVLFALRDLRAPHTVVLKTVMRDPDRRFAGLGFVLTDSARAAAHALGATRAISALQHDGSVARSLSSHAIPFRRYAVFAKELS